tara:strand:- start:823 stop:1743 length:921 start_codon:yes stop_codon:yes gene_type:complete
MVNYRVGKCIGCGSFGKVFVVKDFYGNSYAMKRISTYSISNIEKKHLINEIRILKYNNCPYLLKLVECKANLTNIEIITNYARFGDFSSVIKKKRQRFPIKQFEEQLVWSYFIQVCYGLKYLHNNNIIHRDLKCANVFLDKGDRIFIGDFGTTKVFLDGIKMTNSNVGTPYYMSPEVMNNDKYDKSVDIWGLGCFLFEIMTYNPPFTGRNMQHLTTKIKTKKFSVDIRNFKKDYSRELLLLPEQIFRFYQSICISNILKLKEVDKNIYLIPYLLETTIDISNMVYKFQDISITNWYTICNNINKQS